MEGMFSGGTHLPDVASWARQWPGDRAARDRAILLTRPAIWLGGITGRIDANARETDAL